MADKLYQFTSGRQDAPIVIVGEAWGRNEFEKKRPFCGAAGYELTEILKAVGINRFEDCLLTNIVHDQPYNNEMDRFFYPTAEARKSGCENVRGLYPKPEVMRGLMELYRLINDHPRKLVIAFGNYPLWALTDNCFSLGNVKGKKVPTGIGKWRGSQLKGLHAIGGVPVLPTYHPAAVLRQWSWRFLVVHDLKTRVPLALSGDWDDPTPRHFITGPTIDDAIVVIDSFIHLAKDHPLTLVCDIETRHGHIACIGFAGSIDYAVCIPFMSDRHEHYWSQTDEVEIFKRLVHLFAHPNISFVGQNFTYDIQYIVKQFLVRPKVSFDTMLAHHLCWPGTPKGLDYISSLYCSYHRYWKDEGKDWDGKRPQQELWDYNCTDCIRTYEAFLELRKLIPKLGLSEQWNRQMAQFDLVVDMMLKGVNFDKQAQFDMLMDVNDKINEREAWLEKIISPRIFPPKKKAAPWHSSPIQQMELFYHTFRLPPQAHRKTKRPTVDDEALRALEKRFPILAPVLNTLLELRSLRVFANNFLSAKPDPDGRMRCSYNIAGTETFRWSSNENAFGRGTNLQNIPAGTED